MATSGPSEELAACPYSGRRPAAERLVGRITPHVDAGAIAQRVARAVLEAVLKGWC